jgi:drug/metabolite transporter (DMT)-like permease
LVLSAVALFATFDSVIKLLGGLAPLAMVLWVRYTFQVGITAATALPQRGRALLRTDRPGLQVLRGLSLLSMSALGFVALRLMPVGEFTAIMMLAPLCVTAWAAGFHGDRVSVWRWVLLGGGLLGALAVIRAQSSGAAGHPPLAGTALLLPVAMVAANTAFQLLTSRLARTESPTTTHFYTGLTGFVGTAVLVPWFWQALPASTWGWMVLAAALSSAGHFLLILAYGRARPSVVTPFLYFQLAFATLAGMLFFRYVPDAMAIGGIVLIGACGALGTWLAARDREAQADPGSA